MEEKMGRKFVILFILIAMVTLAGCNFPLAGEDTNAVETSVAQTLEAIESHQQPTLPPLPTLPPIPTATDTPAVTLTPAPTTATAACLFVTMTSETVKDKSVFSPGEAFTKTWTVKNTGTCTWNKDYKIVFRSGNQMGGPDKQALGETVKPGESITISVDLTAPSTAGTYTGKWIFRTDKGVDFGVNGIWTTIVVE